MRSSHCPRCKQLVIHGSSKQLDDHVNLNCKELHAIQILGNMDMGVWHLIETNYLWRIGSEEFSITKDTLTKIRDYISEILEE